MVPGGFRGWRNHGRQVEDRSRHGQTYPHECRAQVRTGTSRGLVHGQAWADSTRVVRLPALKPHQARRSDAAANVSQDGGEDHPRKSGCALPTPRLPTFVLYQVGRGRGTRSHHVGYDGSCEYGDVAALFRYPGSSSARCDFGRRSSRHFEWGPQRIPQIAIRNAVHSPVTH